DREPGIARGAAAVDHGQAHARTGDRSTDGDARGVERASDGDTLVATLLDMGDRADRGDDSGEHAASLARTMVDFERVGAEPAPVDHVPPGGQARRAEPGNAVAEFDRRAIEQ